MAINLKKIKTALSLNNCVTSLI